MIMDSIRAILALNQNRKFDVMTFGRAGVDLYSETVDQPLENCLTFKKGVGGSPANIAAALAQYGRKVGIISKVSHDPFGNYVRQYLNSVGVNTDYISIDESASRTSLAITEMRVENCNVLFYRNKPSDIEITLQEIQEDVFSNTNIFLLSGNALSQSPSREAALQALRYAKKHHCLIVTDLDYRPDSWNSWEEASVYYQLIAEKSNIIVGNQEECALLNPDFQNREVEDLELARTYLSPTTLLMIIKHGQDGSFFYQNNGQHSEIGAFTMPAKKPFGAGDAYMGGFLHSLLNEKSIADAILFGSAAAGIVVTRDSCSEAMPTQAEVNEILSQHSVPVTALN